MQCRLYIVSDHFALLLTYVCELGQEISSNENDGKCLEASRFCGVDCMFLSVLPSIVQMFVSWDRKYAVMRMMGSVFRCKLYVSDCFALHVTDVCELGQEISGDGNCRPCPRGSYQESRDLPVCLPCPYGWTTSTEGAMSLQNCNVGQSAPSLNFQSCSRPILDESSVRFCGCST